MPRETSFPKDKIRIVLFEKVHPAAAEALRASGYAVEIIERALEGAELAAAIADAHIVGLRSRTKIRREQLAAARRLLAVGCFSIGTDQVELDAAASHGVPVFNAPHASTRSVAELALGCIIMLARRLGDKNHKLHLKEWDKSLAGAHEVRGKTLGLVGYGHIGQQVGILAEAFGMRVVFHDIAKKLALGLAQSAASLEELLAQSDFVSLHVPATPLTRHLIGEQQLALLRPGSYVLNLARGSVVDLEALRKALTAGRLGGAALDVFPTEPTPMVAEFDVGLHTLPNVVLTPHIGGNTEEAQKNIGLEVATAVTHFIDRGSTDGAVNFPTIDMPATPGAHRILHIHRNVPGVLAEVTRIVADIGANIEAQTLQTRGEIGYLVMDLNKELSRTVKAQIEKLPVSIRTRLLY